MVEIDGVPTCVCVAKSAVFPNEPEKEGIVRVDDFQQACVLQSDGKTGSRGKLGGGCGRGQGRGFGRGQEECVDVVKQEGLGVVFYLMPFHSRSPHPHHHILCLQPSCCTTITQRE